MKILMINKFFYERGGTEKYLFSLSRNLRQKGHQVLEFSMQDEKNLKSEYSPYFIDKIDFAQKTGWLQTLKNVFHALYSSKASQKLEQLIKEHQPEVAHLHNFNFQLTPSILFTLRKYKIPIVWTLHDYKFLCPNFKLFTQGQVCQRCRKYKFYNCFKYKCLNDSASFSFLAMLEMYLHKIILRSYDLVDAFICPSQFLYQQVKNWGYDLAKFQQVYNFIDLENFLPGESIGDGLIYYGRLSAEKGVLTLLQTAKKLPNIELKIVGTGPQRQELEQYISANNLTNVKLLGYKAGLELSELIKASRLVIVPSVWQENNPIAILEAMALAKPIIGTDLGGIPELVQNQQTGWLFKASDSEDLANKIKAVYDQRELLKNIGQTGRKWLLANCDPHQQTAKVVEIYQKLAQKQA